MSANQRRRSCRANGGEVVAFWLCVVLQCAPSVVWGAEFSPLANPDAIDIRLVYGSYADEENAHRYAVELMSRLPRDIDVLASENRDPVVYRVVGPVASEAVIADWSAEATTLGLKPWRLLSASDRVVQEAQAAATAGQAAVEPEAAPTQLAVAPIPVTTPIPTPTPAPTPAPLPAAAEDEPEASGQPTNPFREFNFDLDLGVQNRLFAHRGSNTSDRAQQSLSAQITASREFSGGANLFAVDVFGRWDSDDAQRSHTDLRELSVTHIADRWQLQAGVGQVFWGVVEFNHLIDVVNQTDLVENPDGEDKLGQPMVTFTALPDWGSVELYVLPTFRTRTLPGIAGRLTFALPIDRGAAEFESGAEKNRIDGLLRVSTQLGGVLFDVYHFNGTRRTPRFEVQQRPIGTGTELFLIPNYDTVKQTALAAQANTGDTAFKLEALQQDGGPESYWAAALGLEHTFVGLFGSAADLGAVVEYHYDSRGGDAFDSFFENDLALGARLAANDINDSQALLGVVWDTSAQEWIVQLEASRRLNDRWVLALESRWFAGGEPIGSDASLADLLNTKNKLGSVQRDDYVQLEFTRFF